MTEKKNPNPVVNQLKKNPTPKFDPKGFKGSKPNKGFNNTTVVRRSGRGG